MALTESLIQDSSYNTGFVWSSFNSATMHQKNGHSLSESVHFLIISQISIDKKNPIETRQPDFLFLIAETTL